MSNLLQMVATMGNQTAISEAKETSESRRLLFLFYYRPLILQKNKKKIGRKIPVQLSRFLLFAQ